MSVRLWVFDLDGVLSHSPDRDLAMTKDEWIQYWKDPFNTRINRPIRTIFNSLRQTQPYDNFLILTARPIAYWGPTRVFLSSGFDIDPWMLVHQKDMSYFLTTQNDPVRRGEVFLLMRNTSTERSIGGQDGHEWKLDVVRNLCDVGFDIQMIFEDYKINADALRQVAPVLLYERIKSQDRNSQ